MPDSAAFADRTTLTSTGAVDSFHDCYTSLGGAMMLLNMMLGEVAPGGTGSGLYGILVLAVITVFVAGLMVGRTPEYLGKKLGAREVKFASLYLLTTPALVLVGTAIAMALPGQRAGMLNTGPHGFSEVLYAFTSAANNNGSAFAGISVNTAWYNTALGHHHAARPVPADGVRPRPGRVVGQAANGAGVRGHAADPPAAVRRHAHRRDADRRRPHLLPGAGTGSARGGSALMTTSRRSPPRRRARRRRSRAPAAASQGGLLDPTAAVAVDCRTRCASSTRARCGKNPVMFIVEIGAVFTTVLAIADPQRVRLADRGLAVADRAVRQPRRGCRRGPRQGAGRRVAPGEDRHHRASAGRSGGLDGAEEPVPAPQLRQGDRVVCEAGDVIPGDGDVIDGIASVDESAITGESAPVIRESGGDRSSVTGGTRVLSDRIVVEITQKPGESFIDRMIALVEGASRQKTPNEIALNILLASLTIIFLLATVTLQPMAIFAKANQPGIPNTAALDSNGITGIVLVSLLVCLIPTTIGALLSAIGIAGMDRLVQRNVLAMSGRAVEAAGDVNTLLLDKTGTITLGNRQATDFLPVGDDADGRLSPTPRSCPRWPTRRRRAARSWSWPRRDTACGSGPPVELTHATWVPFTAQTRMSGVDLSAVDGAPARQIRKGAASAP